MRYLIRRLEFFLVTLWAALTLNFILPRLLPGGPEVALRTRFHGRISSATIKSLEVALGINNHDSLLQQYLAYLSDVLDHSILPAFTIGMTSIGGSILTMRNNMITTLAEDYIKMARAKGLSPARIMLQYAARNAILPNLVGFAMSLGFVIS